jgi:hypothetical protein
METPGRSADEHAWLRIGEGVSWQFFPEGSPPFSWRWSAVSDLSGEVLRQSTAYLPTLYDCIDDARAHGYETPIDRIEKQRNTL